MYEEILNEINNTLISGYDVQMFLETFNRTIIKYGCVTVFELLDNPFLLGEKSINVPQKYLNCKIGWNKFIWLDGDIKYYEGFDFRLNLPQIEEL